MGKRHVLRKKTDVNVLRCILMNINEGFETNSEFYSIEEERFSAFLQALMEYGIVKRISENTLNEDTSHYCIANVEKFNEWSKSNFYRAVEKYIIPLLEVVTSIII